MADSPTRHPDLGALGAWLHAQRPALLAAWRVAVGLDPHVTAAASLGRAQFIDHIPKILDAFEARLRARGEAEREAATERQREGAAEHGVHRWLHGYDSRETMREWGHLQRCLVDALERFALGPPSRDAFAMGVARRLLTDLFVDCIVESAVGHATLQETEAAGRLRDLEQVLESVRALERDRAELWRQAAHDLRGNVGAVQLAATALARSVNLPDSSPAAASRVQRSADLLARLLDDLIELARLEAGQERRHVAPFDAARLVADLCETLQPLAAERGLFLRVEAPAALPVSGDAIKTGRIAQNLLLNSLKYTEHGGVLVTCSEVSVGEVPSWLLCVQDTGVGFDHGSVTPLARVISDATEEAQTVARDSAAHDADGATGAVREMPRAVPTLRSMSGERPPGSRRGAAGGEGIGLAIVKRLCELLDASLELQSEPGRGTTFRIVFPRGY